MSDQDTSNEKPAAGSELPEAAAAVEPDPAPDAAPDPAPEPAKQTAFSGLLPSTDAGRTRMAAAGIAAAFLLAGGIGGYAIGHTGEGPERPGMSWHEGFDGPGPGGARH